MKNSPEMRRLVILGCLAVTASFPSAQGASVWAGGTTYSQNFDGALGAEWEGIGAGNWNTATVPTSGRVEMTGSSPTGGDGKIRNPTVGTAPSVTYPVAPLVTASSYNAVDSRFSGSWLGTQASTTHDGSVSLSFTGLPTHSSISLAFVLTAFDSIDSTDKFPDLTTANFQILVDGVSVLANYFTASGLNGPAGTTIVQKANLNPHYSERFNDNPSTLADRTSTSWELDSVYDMALSTALQNIAHSSSDLTITFRHGLDSAATDEGFAIDSLSLTLIPEPSQFLLVGLGIMGGLMRRNRKG